MEVRKTCQQTAFSNRFISKLCLPKSIKILQYFLHAHVSLLPKSYNDMYEKYYAKYYRYVVYIIYSISISGSVESYELGLGHLMPLMLLSIHGRTLVTLAKTAG